MRSPTAIVTALMSEFIFELKRFTRAHSMRCATGGWDAVIALI